MGGGGGGGGVQADLKCIGRIRNESASGFIRPEERRRRRRRVPSTNPYLQVRIKQEEGGGVEGTEWVERAEWAEWAEWAERAVDN